VPEYAHSQDSFCSPRRRRTSYSAYASPRTASARMLDSLVLGSPDDSPLPSCRRRRPNETLSFLEDSQPTCPSTHIRGTSGPCSPGLKPTSGPSIPASRQLHLADEELCDVEARPVKAEPLGEPPNANAPMSARGSRLNVRDNKKEAIATSMTIDYVSLASCDRGMVQECDDGHAHVEALKRKREDSLVCHETNLLSTMGGRAVPCLSSSEGRSQCASEIRGLAPKGLNLLLRKDPARPQSSRGGCTSSGSPASELFASVGLRMERQGSFGAASTTGSSGNLSGNFLPPRLPGSRSRFVTLQGSECPQGFSRMGSAHGSMSSSLSAFASQAALRMGTPPGASNAFEAHGLLVKCPAPKRATELAPSMLSAH